MFYYPLGRTKCQIPIDANGLAAHFALYAGCITSCIFGGFETKKCGRNGCFARFVGRRRCSFGRRCAVRVAAAGNCAQGIPQLVSVTGKSP